MNPDFTLIWPLSCLKDGDHLYESVRLGGGELHGGVRRRSSLTGQRKAARHTTRRACPSPAPTSSPRDY